MYVFGKSTDKEQKVSFFKKNIIKKILNNNNYKTISY
jgi:hypothetical protein